MGSTMVIEGCRSGYSDPLNEMGTIFTLPRGVPYSLVVRLRAAAKKIDVSAVRSRVVSSDSPRASSLHLASSATAAQQQQQQPPADMSGELLDVAMEGSTRTPLALCCHEGLVEASDHASNSMHHCPMPHKQCTAATLSTPSVHCCVP